MHTPQESGVPPLGKGQGEDSVSSECDYIMHSIDIAKCSCLFLRWSPNNTAYNLVLSRLQSLHGYFSRPSLYAHYLNHKLRDITMPHQTNMPDESLLKKLSVETRTKLRATQILTSLPTIISELLQNAIDAGASQIDIGVDCAEWSCWVMDNGSGFTKDGLHKIGQDSERGWYSELFISKSFFRSAGSTFTLQILPKLTTLPHWKQFPPLASEEKVMNQ